MGGALFQNERMNRETYDRVSQIVIEKLSPRKVLIPESFLDKEDYGDIDFVLPYPIMDKEEVKQLFSITDDDIHINTSVVSINYMGVQCDLCFHSEENVLTAYQYMRNSDCSNMVGVMFRDSLGYRLTHKGLVYPVKFAHDDALGEVLVSKNFRKILEFIDLDYDQWLTGFKNPEELFSWITKSKYFNAEAFKFENLNHENRTRNRKRKVYAEFVEWLLNKEFKNYEGTINKQEHLFRGMFHFYEEVHYPHMGNWTEQIQPLIEQRYYWEKARNTFNGSIIQELTGASGPELGKILREFNEYLKSTYHLTKTQGWVSITYFVADKTKKEMIKIFNNWYKTYEH
jgi:hypothetical protein